MLIVDHLAILPVASDDDATRRISSQRGGGGGGKGGTRSRKRGVKFQDGGSRRTDRCLASLSRRGGEERGGARGLTENKKTGNEFYHFRNGLHDNIFLNKK